MKVQRMWILCLAVILALGFGGTALMAQNIGFRVGIAPVRQVHPHFGPSTIGPITFGSTVNPPIVVPGFAQPMTVPFTTATPFGRPRPQATLTVTRGKFAPRRGFGNTRRGCCTVRSPIVGVPGQVFAPGTVIVPVSPAQFGPEATGQMPPIGTPREQVLRQFGPPVASIITSNSETLFFSGGVRILLKNGQVASPE